MYSTIKKRKCRPKSFYFNYHSQGFRANLLVKSATCRKVLLNSFPICMVAGFHPPTQNYRTALYRILISTEGETGKDQLGRLHLNAAGYCTLNLIHIYANVRTNLYNVVNSTRRKNCSVAFI